MGGAVNQGSAGVPGGLWGTNGRGMASPQQGRPALSGGLQPLQMLQALRGGASMQQLNGMNPMTPRPAQFLPPPVSNFDHGAQFNAQQNMTKPMLAQAPVSPNGSFQPESTAAAGDSGGAGAK